MELPGTQALPYSFSPRPTAVNRRRSVRQKVHTPAYASLRGKSPAVVLDLNEVLDISEEGLCFQGPAQLEFGRSLDFNLDLSETRAYLSATARVIWSEPTGRTGVSFVRMSGPSLLRLKEWLFINSVMACAHYLAGQENRVSTGALEKSEAIAGMVATPPEVVPSADDKQPSGTLAAVEAVQHDVEQVGPDLDSALQLIAARALKLTCATGAAIALSELEEMVCRASAGSDAPPLGAKLQTDSGFSAECVRTGVLMACDDSETDSRVDREICRVLGVRSIAAAPVRSGETVIGLLEVFSPLPAAFGPNERAVLQHLTYIVLGAAQRAVDAMAARARISEAAARFAESESAGPAAKSSFAEPEGTEADSAESASGESGDDQSSIGRDPSGGARPAFLSTGRLVVLAIVALGLGVVAVFLGPAVRSLLRARSAPALKRSVTVPGIPSTTLVAVSDLEGLERLAKQGDPTAQFALGAHFATGDGVPQDYSQAVHWFSLAAEQGHVVAQATLGAYYWAGRGVAQDLSKAYFWSILAQSGGDEASRYRVGVLASHLTREQVIAAQQQANDWLAQHGLSAKSSVNSGR